MEDGRIRYTAAEKAVVDQHAVWCFGLASGNLTGEQNITGRAWGG